MANWSCRSDNKSFRFLNGKSESHFLSKKKPTKFLWTVLSRRVHKKGTAEEVAKKRTRKAVKVQRAVVGATWEDILAKRNQTEAVRKATRDSAVGLPRKEKGGTRQRSVPRRSRPLEVLNAANKIQGPPAGKDLQKHKVDTKDSMKRMLINLYLSFTIYYSSPLITLDLICCSVW